MRYLKVLSFPCQHHHALNRHEKIKCSAPVSRIHVIFILFFLSGNQNPGQHHPSTFLPRVIPARRPSSPNGPVSRPSPRLHVIAVNARGALVRYRGVIAASFEVDVFEVEGVDMAWDDTREREKRGCWVSDLGFWCGEGIAEGVVG